MMTMFPGVNVVTATSGEEALEIVDNQDVHAIISDYRMPGMSGIQLCSILRSKDNDTPFVILTATPIDRIRNTATKIGVAEIFSKSTPPKTLYPSMMKVLLPKQNLIQRV